MPFDPGGLDKATLLLLAVRERLTEDLWSPAAINGADFYEGRGCLIQQLYHAATPEQRCGSDEWEQAKKRLQAVVGCAYLSEIGRFNDTHTLLEVQEIVDRAIGLS